MYLRLRRTGWRPVAFLIALMLAVLLIPIPAYAAGDTPASAGSVVTTTTLWGIVVGIITPPLVAVVQQPTWSTRTRTFVASGIALAFGVIACWVDGSLGHGQTLITTMGAVLIASQSAYRELWSKVGVTQAIEAATSSTPDDGQVTVDPDPVFPAPGSAPAVEGSGGSLADPPAAAVKAPAKRATPRKATASTPAKRAAKTPAKSTSATSSRRSGTSR